MSRKNNSRHKFADEKLQKKPPRDLLEYDTRRAQELGYGSRYGDYKADHPNTRAEFEQLIEKKKTAPARRPITCRRCGGIFYRANNPNQCYCSPECQAEAKAENDKAARQRRANQDKHRICPICGEEFISRHGQKYCTPECSATANRENSAKLREKYRQEAAKHGND